MIQQRTERALTRLRELLESGDVLIQAVEIFLSQYQEIDEVLSYWERYLPASQANRMANICRVCYAADASIHTCLETLNLHLAKSVGCWISGRLTIKVIGISDFVTSSQSRHARRVDFADHIRDLLYLLQHEPDVAIDFWEPARLSSIEHSMDALQKKRKEVARLLIEPTADLIESIKPMSASQFQDLRSRIFRMLDVLMQYAFLSLKEGNDDRVDQIEHLVVLIAKSGNIPLEFEKTDSGVILYVLARPRTGRVSSLPLADE